MAGRATKRVDRRPSMYDPARDIFSMEQEDLDRSAERESRQDSQGHRANVGPSVDQQQSLPESNPSSAAPPSPNRSQRNFNSNNNIEALPNQDEAPQRNQRAPPGANTNISPNSPSARPNPQSSPSQPASQNKKLLPKLSEPMTDRSSSPQAGGPSRNNEAQEPQSKNGSNQVQEGHADDASAAGASTQPGASLKRRRREERPQRPPKREAPSAYSRRDRSPPTRHGASRNSRSVSPRNRAAEFRRSRSPRPRDRSPTPEAQARQRKRPGGGARMGNTKDLLRRRQEERERAQQQEVAQDLRDRGVSDVVRQHYNAVPQRGREWRKTDSKIKGLRSFNNWIKSAVIQKFSPDEEFLSLKTGSDWGADTVSPAVDDKKILVLDLGCGKGGDLGKWQQAPQPVDLYVGLDPADISIDQARDRYSGMRQNRNPRHRRGNPLFHAEFVTKDCFGEWLGDVPIVQQVGIDAHVGPDANLMHARWGGGGFDVVVSMFSMHYAFESEEKARQMLKNVAGALKKGGRFIGVGPNSDVISAKVAEFHANRKAQKAAADKGKDEAPEDGEVEDETLGWGNEIYRVRFPGSTPEDGVFRPPFGWKYSYFMEEAVEEIPEYVVPWEAFRFLTTEYNLELLYRKPFLDIWNEEKDDPELGPLSERMGVRGRNGGPTQVTEEELEAASFYHAFVFHKV